MVCNVCLVYLPNWVTQNPAGFHIKAQNPTRNTPLEPKTQPKLDLTHVSAGLPGTPAYVYLEVEEEVLAMMPANLKVGEEVPLGPCLVVEEEAVRLGKLVSRGEVTRLSSREGESGSECVTGFANANCIVTCSSTLRI
jgi:hypothetical protein